MRQLIHVPSVLNLRKGEELPNELSLALANVLTTARGYQKANYELSQIGSTITGTFCRFVVTDYYDFNYIDLQLVSYISRGQTLHQVGPDAERMSSLIQSAVRKFRSEDKANDSRSK